MVGTGGMRGWQGGMHGCRGHVGGMHGRWGACVVAGGHVWLWGACMVLGGVHGCRGACIEYDKIRSMSGRYASYWNAFLLHGYFQQEKYCITGTNPFTVSNKQILFTLLKAIETTQTWQTTVNVIYNCWPHFFFLF